MAMFTAFLLCTCVPDAHLCVQGFSSRKDTSQAGMGLSLMASFNSVISSSNEGGTVSAQRSIRCRGTV